MDRQSIKKIWFKYVSLWNKGVIFIVLCIIWLLILTPTAIIRRFFQKIFYEKQKKQTSFLKKSSAISSNHFTQPF